MSKTVNVAITGMKVTTTPGKCSYCHLQSCHVAEAIILNVRSTPMCVLCGNWAINGATPKDGCLFRGENNRNHFAIDLASNGDKWRPPANLRKGPI